MSKVFIVLLLSWAACLIDAKPRGTPGNQPTPPTTPTLSTTLNDNSNSTAKSRNGRQLTGVLQAAGGIAEFINLIRNRFGKSGDFTNQHGFDYGQVYNSKLQYAIIQAYQQKQTNDLLHNQLNTQHHTNRLLAETESSIKESKHENEEGHNKTILALMALLIPALAISLGQLVTIIITACRRK